ncbi:MAG: aspartate aminotransferase family protein [Deltaproteobacteria bacterium]|jgi:acetylornithine/N-succinyldiaminopimelate aminotransferase|nr:aspartate aminotransferase family protein [Deltaproteobacteria bacterium]
MSLSNQEIISLGREYLFNNVNRLPLALVKGQGLKVWDADGRQYLDFVAGIATCAFGHCPDLAIEALNKQAHELWHVSNLYWNEPMVKLAKFLVQASGLDKAFFCNSGAEANEAAIKMARKHGLDNFGPERYIIVCALNSFHGRTMGAITATGQLKLQQGFGPMVPGFRHVPFGNIKAIDEEVNKSVCAVLLEPVQGEGGVVNPPDGYLKQVEEICHARGALLILDEIQTGLGRTGRDFAFKHFGLNPDAITIGKALGSGYPIGALLAAKGPAAALSPGTHSTTVGGAPLAMALSLALTQKILEPSFLARVEKVGQYFVNELNLLKTKRPDQIEQIRGLGLMLGLSLSQNSAPVAENLLNKGFLVNATAGTVLRFVPPLTVTEADIDSLIKAIDQALGELHPSAVSDAKP